MIAMNSVIVKAALWCALVGAGAIASAEDLASRIEQASRNMASTVVEWRRYLHAHPELSNREEETSRYVAERLKEIGVDGIETGVARHGIVALIRGGKPGGTVALRADMDALPIQEQTGLAFASQNPGVMHACGHDAHTAILLGAAKALVAVRADLPGTVKLLFQPAEEGAPRGEEGGAGLMIKEGTLASPDVEAIFGLHVSTDLAAGKLAYRDEELLASVDRFRVTITGKQSHAAMPWHGVDPIVAAAHVITALQTIASRKIDAREAVVVSVGILRAGQAWNIIPGEVSMEGTIRTHEPEVRKKAIEEFRRIVSQTAAAMGAQATIELNDYGPAVWNDPALGRRMRPTLLRAAGEGNLVESPPVMGGEDFALYAQEVPGYFVFLGVRNESLGAVHQLHTPHMVIDEAALPLGVRTMALLAAEYLCGEVDQPAGTTQP